MCVCVCVRVDVWVCGCVGGCVCARARICHNSIQQSQRPASDCSDLQTTHFHLPPLLQGAPGVGRLHPCHPLPQLPWLRRRQCYFAPHYPSTPLVLPQYYPSTAQAVLTSGLLACPILNIRWAANVVVVLTVVCVVRQRVSNLVSVHSAAVTSAMIHKRSGRAG